MKYAEIWPLVVEGYRVTCERFGEGTYVDYQFNGLRINHAGGSSSGFTARDEDLTCEWSLVPDEPIVLELPNVTSKEQAERIAKSRQPWGKPPPVDDVLVLEGGKWGKPTPAPDPAPPNVGNAPKRDAWGKPLPSPGKWGK